MRITRKISNNIINSSTFKVQNHNHTALQLPYKKNEKKNCTTKIKENDYVFTLIKVFKFPPVSVIFVGWRRNGNCRNFGRLSKTMETRAKVNS